MSFKTSKGRISLLGILFLASATTACTLPGYNLDDYGSTSPWYGPATNDPRYQSDEVPDEQQVKFHPEVYQITPALVLDQEPPPEKSLPPSLLETPQYDYKVGPGDVLNVVVFNHPELTNPSGTFPTPGSSNVSSSLSGITSGSPVSNGRLVNAEGDVYYPFVGEMHVAGLTLRQIREKISKGLSRVLRQPQVDVRVIQFRSHQVFIAGDIAKPCAVPITDLPLTVLRALEQCDSLGGNSSSNNDGRSPVSTIRLSRDGKIIPLNLVNIYESGKPVYLRDGDRLIVDRSASKIFIVGDFQTQAVAPFPAAGMTLNDAIAAGGGINLTTADPGGIYVIRGFVNKDLGPDGNIQTSVTPKIYHLDAKSVASLILADQFQLRPRDVVYAAPASLVSFNRALAQLTPSLNLLFQSFLIYDRQRR